METKDLLNIADLTPEDILTLLARARAFKAGEEPTKLPGKSLALLFEKPSLRTRVSFDIAMHHLGGHCVYLSPAEVGLGSRESIQDVALVLSRYVDAVAARTFAHETVELLAHYGSIPIINALTDQEHPCQALADFQTLQEQKGELKGLTLAYVGDGNNCATSLLYVAALVGTHFRIASPPGYELSPEHQARAQAFAERSGATVVLTHDPREAVAGADAVYTDVWTSMGQEQEQEVRRRVFASYQINEALLARAKSDVIFLHPLPAHHGEEVAEGILYRSGSVVFDQAENRLHIQKAILATLLQHGATAAS